MNLSKLGDKNPYQDELATPIHIIGCGSVGSTQAELLARYGFKNFKLYDFDIVESKNIVNQMFFSEDINHKKTEALRDLLLRVNPEINETGKITLFSDGYKKQPLSGFVFLCVDNIDLRRQICESNKYNNYIKAVFDYRTLRFDAQHYAADWSDKSAVANLIASMQFTHEEAKAETPVSACGIEIGEAAVVRGIVVDGTTNFFNFIKNKVVSPFISSAPYNHNILAM